MTVGGRRLEVLRVGVVALVVWVGAEMVAGFGMAMVPGAELGLARLVVDDVGEVDGGIAGAGVGVLVPSPLGIGDMSGVLEVVGTAAVVVEDNDMELESAGESRDEEVCGRPPLPLPSMII